MAKRRDQPLSCWIDREGNIRYTDTNSFIFNRRGDLVKLSQQEIDRLISEKLMILKWLLSYKGSNILKVFQVGFPFLALYCFKLMKNLLSFLFILLFLLNRWYFMKNWFIHVVISQIRAILFLLFFNWLKSMKSRYFCVSLWGDVIFCFRLLTFVSRCYWILR